MRDPELHLTSPRARALYEYWASKGGARRLPSRADIDPAEIKSLLPYILLTDLHHDPLRVFFRLVGTAVAEAVGRNITGQWLHEVPLDGGFELWLQTYRRLVDTREPIVGRNRATVQPGDERLFEWIILPLSSDGNTVDKTLELEDWEALCRMSAEEIEQASWNVEVLK